MLVLKHAHSSTSNNKLQINSFEALQLKVTCTVVFEQQHFEQRLDLSIASFKIYPNF